MCLRTLDDVECSPDFANVLTIRGMNPNNRGSGLTVSKLRIFCSAVPNLPKGYSNANKDDLLKMLSNRKKGKVFGVQFGNAIENKASTPIPLNKIEREGTQRA